MTKNKIEYGVKQIYYSIGPLYECRFQYRYGTYKQFTKPLARTHIPICNEKILNEYIDKQTKLLSEIWRLNPPKKKQK